MKGKRDDEAGQFSIIQGHILGSRALESHT